MSVLIISTVSVAARAVETPPPMIVPAMRLDDGKPARTRSTDELERTLLADFGKAAGAGYVLLSPEEALKQAQAMPQQGFHESKDALAELAGRAHVHYGLSLWVFIGTLQGRLPAQLGVTLTTWVVGTNGEEFRAMKSFAKPLGRAGSGPAAKREAIRSVFKTLAAEALTDLRLQELAPVVAERRPAASAGPAAEVPAAGTSTTPNLAPRNPAVPADAPMSASSGGEVTHTGGSPLRTVGYVGIAVGAAAAVGGLVAFALEPSSRVDAQGYVYDGDLARHQTAKTLAGAGVGLLAAGLAVAATGVVLAVGADSWQAKPSVAVTRGGLGCFVTGVFP